ncbi:NAD(P)/FAD-dependent oxidoreductase [Nocardiopsis sp. NPDC050513]|uniref:NAD(P)/FAD-dependent oxidoreductase n=1 Tax=Nocardiopsis sp. NPDC050513 TaxID=3364338 RepID=UPI0037A3EC2C
MTARATRSVCVVGAGLAAVSTAAELRALGFEGVITMLGAEPHQPYDRPPLSKDVLLGKADAAPPLRPEAWYADNAVDLRLGTRAVGLRRGERRVQTAAGGFVEADAVVLATGGRARRLPVAVAPGVSTHVLRTVEDAQRLRAALVPGARVLCVGAGLIGAEIASSATALGARVTLVDPVSVPLEPVLGRLLARTLHETHAERGIRVLHGTLGGVRASALGTRLAAVSTADGPVTVEADVVVAGIGMAPDTEVAVSAGLDTDRGVLVDDARRTSTPHVYAVGDAAQSRPGSVRPAHGEHWDNALTDGRAAAAAILGRPRPEPSAPWFWSDRHGTHVEAVGHMGDAERVVVRGDPDAGSFTVFGLIGDRCVAAGSLDRSADIRAARRLVDRGTPVADQALADESVPLKRLLRR